MKLVLTLFFLLLCRTLAFGAFALDQGTAQQDIQQLACPLVFSYPSPVATGAISVVYGTMYTTGGGPTEVTDDQSNIYTLVVSAQAGRMFAFIAYSVGVAANTSEVSIACDSSPYAEVVATSFTATTPAVDTDGTASDPGPQATDATVSTDNGVTVSTELAIVAAGICSAGSSDNAIIGPAGFTDTMIQQDCNAYTSGQAGYKISSGLSGIQTFNWSHNNITGSTADDGWATAVVMFKETTGAAPRPSRRPILIQ